MPNNFEMSAFEVSHLLKWFHTHYYYFFPTFLGCISLLIWDVQFPSAHTHYFKDWGSARLMSRPTNIWPSVFETVLLKPFFILPLRRGGVGEWLALSWLCWLTGRRRQKSWASWGEQRKKTESAGKLWCVFSFLLKLQNSCGRVANKTRSRFSFQFSLLFTSLSILFTLF